MQTRKIKIQTTTDILHWGYQPKGMFTINEGYHIQGHHNHAPGSPIWKKIWSMFHWPKVAYFLWLVSHQKILTWFNMQNRGMIGPSVCSFCRKANETTKHIFNSCDYVVPLWRSLEFTFRCTDRDPAIVINTLLNWRKGGYKCVVLNRAWQLVLGFLIWDLWKERNHQIFQGEDITNYKIWEKVLANFQETILVEKWLQDDWKAEGFEVQILHQLNLHPQMLAANL